MSTLNLINAYLAYRDTNATDNPQMRSFDWTRKFSQIYVENPTSNARVLAPGETYTIFDGQTATLLDGTSVLSIALLPNQQSLYRVTVTAGASGFRTARTIASLGAVSVAVNNNALAVFNFGSAVLTGVQVGDVLRIAGTVTNDTGPFAFNPLNAGLWSVVGIAGTAISCVRLPGCAFSAATETVSAPGANDVTIYSAAGVQVGAKVRISGTLSSASQRTYQVAAVTPTTFDFLSAIPLPNQSGLSYSANSISFYVNSKRFMYLEFDQECVLRMNGDSGASNALAPIVAADQSLVGFTSKWGETYAATVQNTSVSPLNLSWYLAE